MSAKKNILFFPGYQCSLKRYSISGYALVSNLNEKPKFVMCHSLGIANALIYCHEQKWEGMPIICLDTTSFAEIAANQKSREISTKFNSMQINPRSYRLFCFDERTTLMPIISPITKVLQSTMEAILLTRAQLLW